MTQSRQARRAIWRQRTPGLAVLFGVMLAVVPAGLHFYNERPLSQAGCAPSRAPALSGACLNWLRWQP